MGHVWLNLCITWFKFWTQTVLKKHWTRYIAQNHTQSIFRTGSGHIQYLSKLAHWLSAIIISHYTLTWAETSTIIIIPNHYWGKLRHTNLTSLHLLPSIYSTLRTLWFCSYAHIKDQNWWKIEQDQHPHSKLFQNSIHPNPKIDIHIPKFSCS